MRATPKTGGRGRADVTRSAACQAENGCAEMMSSSGTSTPAKRRRTVDEAFMAARASGGDASTPGGGDAPSSRRKTTSSAIRAATAKRSASPHEVTHGASPSTTRSPPRPAPRATTAGGPGRRR